MYLNDDLQATGTTANGTKGPINLPLMVCEIQAVVFFKLVLTAMSGLACARIRC